MKNIIDVVEEIWNNPERMEAREKIMKELEREREGN